MSDALLSALQGSGIADAMRDADRLATLSIFGEATALTAPDAVAFSAGAIELVAIQLARSDDQGAQDAAREAFELLRGLIVDPALDRRRAETERSKLRLRAACFGVLGDLPSQTRQLLRGFDPAAIDSSSWGSTAENGMIYAWICLLRRDGWSDVDRVHATLARLRESQADLEPAFLDQSDGNVVAAWSLIAAYHLARAAEIVADFTENGSVGGAFNPVEQAQVHFDRARDAYGQASDGDGSFLCLVLEQTVRQLIANSIWTAARGAGTRAQAFVQQLASRARPRPILDLLPPQRRALVDAGLIGTGRRSVVVSLPTSGGKTLVAEFRILQALDRYDDVNGWVAYTAPTRALVNQLTSRLRRDLRPLGIRVERFSPALEVDSVEAEILEGASDNPFRVVVTTPEKLDLLLRGGWTSELGRPLTLVIIDEAHNLGEGSRGLRLELLLATVNREFRDASFMLLTPFVPNASEIAGWLDEQNNQSIELGLEWLPNDRVVGLVRRQHGDRRGDSVVLAETLASSASSLHVDELVVLNSGRPLGRTYSQLDSPSYLAAAAAEALQQRGSTVTLVHQPDHSWSLAQALAERSVDALADEYVGAVQQVLRAEYGAEYPLIGLLKNGVTVHHAGLSDDVRGMVEALAERGLLRHIVATTTLAQGINFPISNVVLATNQYPYGVDMPAEDFWNVAGRAGRADHGQAGIVLLSAPTTERAERLRVYVQSAAENLSSTLVTMVADAIQQFGSLDLARLSFRGEWSAFVQFITHTYRIAGADVFANQVEQVLRGTLGFRTLRVQNPGWADALVQSVRVYTADLAGKPISLVDSTGFSWQSVSATLARLSEAGLGGQPLGADLFATDSDTLREAIGVLLQVPELREQLVERLDASESSGDFIARVVKDWVGGRSLSDIASEYFSSTSAGEQRDATKALTRCCQRLFGSILPSVSWGLSALQALSLAASSDEIPVEQQDLASFVYYGVSSRDAVALRLFGVPRGAAGPLAAALSQASATTDDLRTQLAASSEDVWRAALGNVGPAYFKAWQLVESAA